MDSKKQTAVDLSKEAVWVEELTNILAAKPLMQHFSVFEAIVRSGGQRGVEPPIDQASTWRRMFCWEYSHTDNPYGISGSGGVLPKCIAMCNLSGQHAFYYSRMYSLGKILCLCSVESQARVVSGVSKLFEKAEEMGASVLVCFCLPFQMGLDKCYWEARTIRKTGNGVVKDGELSFTINDLEPRVVSSTLSSEHWPQAMFEDLNKRFLNVASPVCLDKTEKGEAGLSPEKMSVAIEILKTDRKKMIEQHTLELAMTKELHSADIQKMNLKIKDADHKADKRVSGVISSCKASEETAQNSIAAEKKNNMELMKKLSSANDELNKSRSRMADMMLEQEQHATKALAREKALQAQLAQLTASNSKQLADHGREVKQMTKNSAAEVRDMSEKFQALQNQLAAAKSAMSAVSAGAKEALKLKKDAESQLAHTNVKVRVMRALLLLMQHRFQCKASEAHSRSTADARALACDMKGLEDAVRQTQSSASLKEREVQQLQTQLSGTATELEDLRKAAAVDADKLKACRELSESKQADAEKRHLISELQKRNNILESKTNDLDLEVRRLNAVAQHQAYASQTQFAGKRIGRADESSGSKAPNTNTSQNTGVFISQPPHQQAFPQCAYKVDPALEGMVSQLHSALNCITSMARSASQHKRDAEVAQAKSDALLGSMHQCYEHTYTQAQTQFYPNGY